MKNTGIKIIMAVLCLSLTLLSGCGKEKEKPDEVGGATSSGAYSSSQA